MLASYELRKSSSAYSSETVLTNEVTVYEDSIIVIKLSAVVKEFAEV